MEFELVELPQALDFTPRPLPGDARFGQRQRHVPVRRMADRRDQAMLIPDQEYGS